MYEATRLIQGKGKNQTLLIENGEGVTTNEEEQVKHITTYFSTFFNDENTKNLLDVKPCKMREPFTTTEITTAIQSLKNNKTPGIDGLKAEQLKHSPSIVHEMIAEIFNNISETGNKPNELTTGILIH